MKEIKEKIVEILKKVDELHSDGFALEEYLDKLADQILGLLEAEKKKWLKGKFFNRVEITEEVSIPKELLEHLKQKWAKQLKCEKRNKT